MKLFAIFCLFAVVAAKTTYPNPASQTNAYPPQPYSFSWAVKDEASFNDYSHSENSDGNVVTGSYRVALPDGRVQIVTYRADSNGYVADVKYEGTAKYADYKPIPGVKWIPGSIAFPRF